MCPRDSCQTVLNTAGLTKETNLRSATAYWCGVLQHATDSTHDFLTLDQFVWKKCEQMLLSADNRLCLNVWYWFSF